MLEAILKKIAVLCYGKGIIIALAGGFAYSLYCGPRATVDLDFVVLTDKDLHAFEGMLKRNFPSVYRNLETIHYPLVTINRFLLMEGDEETVLDLLIVNDSDYGKSVFSRTRIIEYDDTKIPVVSPEDLIILKKKSSREQDRLDARRLVERLAGDLDEDYIDRWENSY